MPFRPVPFDCPDFFAHFNITALAQGQPEEDRSLFQITKERKWTPEFRRII
jgi:hypothetical protein